MSGFLRLLVLLVSGLSIPITALLLVGSMTVPNNQRYLGMSICGALLCFYLYSFMTMLSVREFGRKEWIVSVLAFVPIASLAGYLIYDASEASRRKQNIDRRAASDSQR